VRCSEPDCSEPAAFKIAAPWKDDSFSGLRAYGFACIDHLERIHRSSEVRWLACEPVPEEMVMELGIYRFEPGKLDSQAVRDRAVEESLRF
jgi:hypothetical protein